MATRPYFFDVPNVSVVRIANADTTTLKTLVTAAANGTKVVGITLTSDDTSARDVTIGITRSAVFYPLGTVTVPITAGTIAATAGVNALDRDTKIPGLPVDSDGNPFLHLASGDTLQIKALVTVTSAKFINAVAFHGDDA